MTRGRHGRCDHSGGHRPLQGIQDDGQYQTACAKIYPNALNWSIATAVSRFLTERDLHSKTWSPLDLQELNSTEFTCDDVVQPDYHHR